MLSLYKKTFENQASRGKKLEETSRLNQAAKPVD
jgi:hypothetical protein